MNAWIDFKALREQLEFAEVLRGYGVDLNIKNDQHHGFCPLPSHKGERNSASFSANLKKGIWQCFGCSQKGNLLDFAVLMEGLNPENGNDVRRVALQLKEKLLGTSATVNRSETELAEIESERVLVNEPLDFELKGLDPHHPYFSNRRLTPETVAHFGLGYCSRGLLRDRIAIPLHNGKGQLVGYAGRVVDDETISEDNPKYRFPGERRRKGVVHGFRKSLLLYNAHRIVEPLDDLIVVEGFTSVWWLTQSGISSVVGTMGATCSEEQAAMIVSLVSRAGRIWVFSDGDIAGARCAGEILVRVTPHRFARWIKMEANRQPTGVSPTELKELFTF
jgi:DNA primase